MGPKEADEKLPKAYTVYVLVSLFAMLLAAPGTITVHLDQPGRPVNPLILGHSIEAADPYGIFGDMHRYSDSRNGEGFWDPIAAAPVSEAIAKAKQVRMGMLRYPGGCLAHGFRWQDAVGPVGKRPNFAFGIEEYLRVCRAIGCEPLMNVSDYSCTPDEAAQLVEYLNSPADAAHPWAELRAKSGHPEPHKVRYFEMGNESDHGNHDLVPRVKWSAQDYAAWFENARTKMKAVDSSIQIGALTGTGTGPFDPWNQVIYTQTKPDFLVVHTYSVNVSTNGLPAMDPEDLMMRATLASADQIVAQLAIYRSQFRSATKRDIPLAITEYNAGFVQEQPKPYRFSFGAAMFSADYLGHLLDPNAGVLMANYWQFINGYWGMVRDDGNMPAYEMYRLWASHIGEQFVSTDVDSPRVEFEGYPGHVKPAKGSFYQAAARLGQVQSLDSLTLETHSEAGYTMHRIAGGIHVDLNGVTGEHYPVIAAVSGTTGNSYEVTFEARASGLQGSTMGISLLDGRGWEPYHSGSAAEGLESAKEWRTVTARLDALPECPSLLLAWRFLPKATTANGWLEVRNIQVRQLRPERFPAYPALSVTATRSQDGRTIHLVIFNRDPKQSVRLDGIKGLTGFRSGEIVTLTAPDLAGTSVTTSRKSFGGGAPLTIPAASMTGITLRR